MCRVHLPYHHGWYCCDNCPALPSLFNDHQGSLCVGLATLWWKPAMLLPAISILWERLRLHFYEVEGEKMWAKTFTSIPYRWVIRSNQTQILFHCWQDDFEFLHTSSNTYVRVESRIDPVHTEGAWWWWSWTVNAMIVNAKTRYG